MKKNILLYVLLFFLIIVNGFFLYNYLGKPDVKKEGKDPMSFVIKQLNFDDEQLQEMQFLNKKHHKKMMRINDGVKELKDALFNRLSDIDVDEKVVDSITALIGLKEKELDKEAFYHFRSIQELCNDKQKEKFKSIIKDALHKGREQGDRPAPREGGPDGQRLPHLGGPEGNRLPPPNH
ncbi:hypothetical protein QLS71_011130 [Mariniflexile litorale]|uniref:Heavy-metal resistance protein n=1 Tax=Mariniflexile litorale TaxID=3045158 RepID=A0AAU7EBT7_9FLAO|nr:hypothetical protein [Mariniflexile sp. KMM 9835]MDQ8212616.1 hypothetical protein [Mariniflexile sp. KMM 9835]